MNSKTLTDDNFQELLDSAEDITDTFDLDMGGLPENILDATNAAKPYLDTLRLHMLNTQLRPNTDLSRLNFGLLSMPEWARYHGDTIKGAIAHGEIMAIDGTPLIHHQRFLTQQVYACAVGGLTARAPLDLKSKVVKVKAKLEGSNSKLADVARVVQQADQLTETSSWPSAFLDYQERDFAYASSYSYIILDGPIVTQNLLTRHPGRNLLRNMLGRSERKCYVGVIKNILNSDAELRFHARALFPGEMYVNGTIAAAISEERKAIYAGETKRFIEEIGANILRGVYKPGRKAFGFECHRNDLPAIVSLLWIDRNSTPGFEIPFLLAQVDAQLRSRYRPGETMNVIEGTLARQGEDEFFDETDERNLR